MKGDECVFYFGDGHDDDLSALLPKMEDFLAKHHEAARIVSFHDRFPDPIAGDSRCLFWRSSFNYDAIFESWQESYAGIDRLLERLPQDLCELLEPHYHDGAVLYWQALVLKRSLSERQAPIFFLLPRSLRGMIETEGRQDEGMVMPSLWLSHLSGLTRKGKRFFAEFQRVLAVARNNHRERRIAIWRGDGVRVIDVAWALVAELGLAVRYFFRTLVVASSLFGLASVLRKMLRVARAVEEFADARKHLATMLDDMLRTGENGQLVVMTVEDSGTLVNLKPGLAIAEKFQERRAPLLVLSSNVQVVGKFRQHGVAAVQVMPTLLDGYQAWRRRGGIKRLLADGRRREAPLTPETCVLDWLLARVTSFLLVEAATRSILDNAQRTMPVGVVLSIYECLPLSIMAGLWARHQSLPWIGFFPILVGDRPDGHHFPAPEHLVYGEQLRDLITSDGHPPGSTIVVGSPTYDAFVGRNYKDDRTYCDTEFPGSRGKKLVVVATEAFADPLVEIGPILEAMGGMTGVFIVLKVHPSDSLQFFEQYVATLQGVDNIQVVGPCDLGALLHAADLLVCIISNIIISAAVLGTPTLVCDFSNKRRVLDFVATGLCHGCFDPECVGEYVKRMLFDPNEEVRTLNMLANGVRYFNGPSDGQSAKRIVDFTLERARSGAAKN